MEYNSVRHEEFMEECLAVKDFVCKELLSRALRSKDEKKNWPLAHAGGARRPLEHGVPPLTRQAMTGQENEMTMTGQENKMTMTGQENKMTMTQPKPSDWPPCEVCGKTATEAYVDVATGVDWNSRTKTFKPFGKPHYRCKEHHGESREIDVTTSPLFSE